MEIICSRENNFFFGEFQQKNRNKHITNIRLSVRLCLEGKYAHAHTHTTSKRYKIVRFQRQTSPTKTPPVNRTIALYFRSVCFPVCLFYI